MVLPGFCCEVTMKENGPSRTLWPGVPIAGVDLVTLLTLEAMASVLDVKNPGSFSPVLTMMIRNTRKTADGRAMRLRLYQERAALA